MGREPNKIASIIVPSLIPPPHTVPQTCPGKCLRLSPLQQKTGMPRQINMAQMKEQIKIPEKELRNKEIANLSDAEFKTLVIRMLTEMVEYGCKIEEEMKPM